MRGKVLTVDMVKELERIRDCIPKERRIAFDCFNLRVRVGRLGGIYAECKYGQDFSPVSPTRMGIRQALRGKSPLCCKHCIHYISE